MVIVTCILTGVWVSSAFSQEVEGFHGLTSILLNSATCYTSLSFAQSQILILLTLSLHLFLLVEHIS